MSNEYTTSPSTNQHYSSPLIKDSGSPNYHYHRPRAGIYGWRKRCLYCTLLILGILSLLNLALTAWIMRHLRFNWRGFGNMKIMHDHIAFNGNTVFNKPLRIANIEAPKDGNLNLISDRSIIMQAKDRSGNISNLLYIGPNGLISQGPKFEVKNKNGHTLFAVTPDNMTIKTHTLNVNGKNGGRFKDSIQTSLIRAPPTESLRIESLTRMMDIEANGINVKALAGNVNVLALQDIILNSQEGRILVQGNKIFFPGLTNPNVAGALYLPPGSRTSGYDSSPGDEDPSNPTYKGIFQLCVCENGRLFLSLPTVNCQGTFEICNDNGVTR